MVWFYVVSTTLSSDSLDMLSLLFYKPMFDVLRYSMNFCWIYLVLIFYGGFLIYIVNCYTLFSLECGGCHLLSLWMASINLHIYQYWVLLFHTHIRGKRINRICPYSLTVIHYPLRICFNVFSSYWVVSYSPSCTSPYPPPASHIHSKSQPSCYHHIFGTHVTGILSASSNRSRIGRVEIYYSTVLLCLCM